MQLVGAHHQRARVADHVALVEHEQERDGDRDRHHGHAERRIRRQRRLQQVVSRLDKQERGGAADEGRLAETGQGLGLAVAESVLAVGRGHRLVHGDDIEDRGDRVQ